ncbi:MAG: SGNH/GDSL hydrolase family protein [Planctomycetes bacterium]|nr:SGNH/GDSL hydrolase family protein [Planctomycetota bacterium]
MGAGVASPEGSVARGSALTCARLLIALGVGLLLLAALFGPGWVARFHARTPLTPEALAETARSRLAFAAAGGALLVLGVLLGRGALRVLERPRRMRIALALLGALLPLLLGERLARPFVERLTTLLEPDAELAWRNRANAADTYWGVPARIDARGLRAGPPARAADARRVLVLGDSVVFGLAIADEAQTLPACLARELEGPLRTPFEALNAGVAGWATWQERRFLEREGARLAPELVVLVFVLNDATSPQTLTRFGGGTQGVPLLYARPPGLPDWLAESGLYLAARELALRRALAADSPAARAFAARLTPYHLLLEPDSMRVREAWAATQSELEILVAWCRTHALPLALVVCPYALQLERPELDAPQRVLARFADEHALPFVDLLPALVRAGREHGWTTQELFVDGVHPSALGHAQAAREIARELCAQGVVR